MFVVFFLCRLLDPSGEWFPLNFSLCLGYSCQNTVIGWDLWKTGLEWKFMCMLFMGAKSLQSCPTLCDAMDCSLSGSSVHEILEAKILEWVVVPSSRCISDPRISTPPPPAISCFDMQVLHNQCHLGSPLSMFKDPQFKHKHIQIIYKKYSLCCTPETEKESP